MGGGLWPNQSDCRISNLDQSEGWILYHVTWPRENVILRSGTEFIDWVLDPLGQHGIEATGSDVIKPEVSANQRQTTWFGKNTLLFSVLDSLEEWVDLAGGRWCKDDPQSNGLVTRISRNECA